MTRRQIKLLIYCGGACCSTAISGLNVGMFGDGTLDWAHFRFAWVLFFIGLAATVFVVLRAAYDQDTSSTNPPSAVVPVELPVPVQNKPSSPPLSHQPNQPPL